MTLLIICCFTSLISYGQTKLTPFILTTDTLVSLNIDSAHWEILADELEQYSIHDLLSGKYENQYCHKECIPASSSNYATCYWTRYTMINQSGHSMNLCIENNYEIGTTYLIKKANSLDSFPSGMTQPWSKKGGFKLANCVPIELKDSDTLSVYIKGKLINKKYYDLTLDPPISMSYSKLKSYYDQYLDNNENPIDIKVILSGFLVGFFFFAVFFNVFCYITTRERIYLYFAGYTFFSIFNNLNDLVYRLTLLGMPGGIPMLILNKFSYSCLMVCLTLFFLNAFRIKVYFPKWRNLVLISLFAFIFITLIRIYFDASGLFQYQMKLYKIFTKIESLHFHILFFTLLLVIIKLDKKIAWVAFGAFPIIFYWGFLGGFSPDGIWGFFIHSDPFKITGWFGNILSIFFILWFILFFSWILFRKYKSIQLDNRQKDLENERLAKEKEIERNQLIEKQKTELEVQVANRTAELNHSIQNLKSTQAQLIQSEKMASLGELTAGIAHEIQNPLNFVNNFSEINNDLIQDAKHEIDRLTASIPTQPIQELKDVLDDIKINSEKINLHGKRASSIVKNMLEHSRTSSGEKTLTDINALCDEYSRIAYQGLRAKYKEFHSDYILNLDINIPKANVVSQDISRVLLNLMNNAFYACFQQSVNKEPENQNLGSTNHYKPCVTIETKDLGNKIQITVSDNGVGIPDHIKDKIFQPFFTTKPTGEGTGLGLSLSYDIAKAQGGELICESHQGLTMFTFTLPIL